MKGIEEVDERDEVGEDAVGRVSASSLRTRATQTYMYVGKTVKDRIKPAMPYPNS